MRILAPASLAEQQKMLRWAIEEYDGPVAVRYPRGGQGSYTGSDWEPGKGLCCHRAGTDVALVTYGTLVNNVLEAAELLERSGTPVCCGCRSCGSCLPEKFWPGVPALL